MNSRIVIATYLFVFIFNKTALCEEFRFTVRINGHQKTYCLIVSYDSEQWIDGLPHFNQLAEWARELVYESTNSENSAEFYEMDYPGTAARSLTLTTRPLQPSTIQVMGELRKL